MSADLIYIVRWFLALLLLSAAVFPLVLVIFPGFKDFGYIFSKPLGLILCGGLMWVLSVFRVLKFNKTDSYICTGIIFVLSFFILFISRKISGQSLKDFINAIPKKRIIITVVVTEAAFFLLLLYFCYLRGCTPAAYGTERFMDYGFIKAISRSPYMPAPDIWYAGENINYYYVGQFLAAFLIKLSGNSVAYGYNLCLMCLPAMGFIECFSIVGNLLCVKCSEMKKSRFVAVCVTIGGIIAGLANTVAGNVHYLIYGLFNLAGKPDEGPYYYWDSTRFIGYNPDVEDKTIHEYPAYSFVLGDLHAHVINYIFVLAIIGILLAWYLNRRMYVTLKTAEIEGAGKDNGSVSASGTTGTDEGIDSATDVIGTDVGSASALKTTETDSGSASAAEKIGIKHLIAEAFTPQLVLIGVMLGLFHGINFWDFPIYYIVSGAVILFTNIFMYRKFKPVLLGTLFQAISIMGIARICALPFTMKFRMIASQVKISHQHTPLWQFLILWGLPVFVCLLFCIAFVFELRAIEKMEAVTGGNINNKGANADNSDDVSAGANAETNKKTKKDKKKRVGKAGNSDDGGVNKDTPDKEGDDHFDISSDIFMLIMALCALGLLIGPEILYVDDIYQGAYERTNTMFKLVYQAWILFGLCFGYMLVRMILVSKKIVFRVLAVVPLIVFLLTVDYFRAASDYNFGGLIDNDYKTLNASAFMFDDYIDAGAGINMLDDKAAIQWINNNVRAYPTVVLEANGDSYTFYERISVFTGQPTVLGWGTHEWLWRSEDVSAVLAPEEQRQRVEDVKAIYTSGDEQKVKELIKQYNISYIVIGYNEQCPRQCDEVWQAPCQTEFLKSLGEVVFTSNYNEDYPLYIVDVRKLLE